MDDILAVAGLGSTDLPNKAHPLHPLLLINTVLGALVGGLCRMRGMRGMRSGHVGKGVRG